MRNCRRGGEEVQDKAQGRVKGDGSIEEGQDIPHNKRSPLFWKLINILFSNRITPI